MKSKIVITAVLFLVVNIHSGILAQQETDSKTFTGIITYFEDSGLGPHYSLDVENSEMNESLTALVGYDIINYLQSQFGENVVGKKVLLTYNNNEEYHASNVVKADEHTPPAGEENEYIVKGKFSSCEIGDMGGYLDITLPDDEWMSFMTDFQCPDDIMEGEDVIVYYTIDKLVNVIDIKAL